MYEVKEYEIFVDEDVYDKVAADKVIIGDSGTLMFFDVEDGGNVLVRAYAPGNWRSCFLVE